MSNAMLRDIRETKRITDASLRGIDYYSKDIGFNKNNIKKALNLTYHEYRNVIVDEMAKAVSTRELGVVGKNGLIEASDKENAEYLNMVFQFLDNCYSFKNSKNFIIELSKIGDLVNGSGFVDIDDVDFDSCGDFFVDFSIGKNFAPFSLKFLKADYTLEMTNIQKEVESYNLALLTLTDKGVVNNAWCATFVRDMYPRVYVDTNDNGTKCEECKRKNIKNYICKQDGMSVPIPLCLVGKNTAEFCKVVKKTNTPSLDFHTLLGVVAHICKSYKNRNTVTRKNSKFRKTYEKAEVHVAKNNDKNEDVIIKLDLYAKTERREKREWQGGHHSSPVEHERRAHYRNYRDKDGNVIKTVKVSGTIVNKGNGKAVYRV